MPDDQEAVRALEVLRAGHLSMLQTRHAVLSPAGTSPRKQKKKANKSKTKPNPVVKKEVRQDGVTEYTVRKIMTDKQIKNRIGRYFPEKHY